MQYSLYLQDIMEDFFSEDSTADPGTLYNIKQRFKHRSVNKNVMHNFQHTWDMLEVYQSAFDVNVLFYFEDILYSTNLI